VFMGSAEQTTQSAGARPSRSNFQLARASFASRLRIGRLWPFARIPPRGLGKCRTHTFRYFASDILAIYCCERPDPRLPGGHSAENLSEPVTVVVGPDAGLASVAAFLVERASHFH
jgi:hypothetical protein